MTADDTVLELVRVALGTPRTAAPVALVDVDLVVRAAQLGVLEQVIAAAPASGFTAEAEALVESAVRAAALRGTRAETVAWRIQRALRDVQVPSLILKGVALAAMTGRVAGERAGVDTDVLVRPVDWPVAHEALVAAGYELEAQFPAPRARDSLTRFLTFSNHAATYTGPGGPIDVHWRLVPGHLASLSATALLGRAVDVQLAGTTVATLDPDAMLAHVALHGAKDSWRSARTLVDAHLLVTVAGSRWSGAAALVGRSPVVAELQAAVEAFVSGPSAGPGQRFAAAPVAESVASYARRRAALTPTPSSATAVGAAIVLPRQVVARSSLPRRLWWLAVVPRAGRAVGEGLRVVTTRAVGAAERSPATGSGATPAPPSRLRRARRDVTAVSRDLVRWYSGASSSEDTYRVVRGLHLRTAGVSSAALLGVMRATPGATDHVRRRDLLHARARSGRAHEDLRANGLAVIEPVLDDDAVTRLRGFAERAPAKLRLADGRTVDGTYADRHPDTVLATIPGAFVWANGDVQHLIASARLQDLALARFGLAPVVHLPTIYWSCVPAGLAVGPEARLGRVRRFHVDYDGIQSFRAYVYLTDVHEGTAPFHYVPGSHRVGSLRGRGFRVADRGLDEAAVSERFGAGSIRSVSGRAGTTFVADPRGLHRATAPEDGDRLFLAIGIQAGAFAGAFHRRRVVPVRDDEFRRLLDEDSGPLRLYQAIVDDGPSNGDAVRVARLA